MGRAKEKKAKFLSEHPFCCFCGGATPATTEDHQPARALFDKKVWPEGYVFPACQECNSDSRLDEQIISLIARINPGPATEEQRWELKTILQGVNNNHPDMLRRMVPSTRQKRDASKIYGLQPRTGRTYSELPLISMDEPRIQLAIKNFSRKLFCALYYYHTHKILMSESPIEINFIPNLEYNFDIERFREFLPNGARGSRNNTALGDQFFYDYWLDDEHTHAIFLAFFRQSFAILGSVGIEQEADAADEDDVIFPHKRVTS